MDIRYAVKCRRLYRTDQAYRLYKIWKDSYSLFVSIIPMLLKAIVVGGKI